MKRLSFVTLFVVPALLLMAPLSASAQQLARPTASGQVSQSAQGNVPAQAQRAGDAVEDVVERFGIGVFGGVGLDPELIQFGGHARFGPVFTPALGFRPGIEFGVGELTTMFAINLDVLYTLPGSQDGWRPYVGVGPTFGLSHRGFEAEGDDADNVDTDDDDDQPNRFDFGDTDFNGGMNFIAGARKTSGVFFEMRATAGGVSNVRLLAGFNF